jgi:hypothetical protein
MHVATVDIAHFAILSLIFSFDYIILVWEIFPEKLVTPSKDIDAYMPGNKVSFSSAGCILTAASITMALVSLYRKSPLFDITFKLP